MGEALAPALGAVAKVLGLITDKFIKWISENKELATNIGIAVVGVMALLATGAAIYAMSFAFSGLAIAIGLVVAVVKLLIVGLALLLTPIGIVLALFGLLLSQSDSISEAIGYVILAMAIPIAVVVIAVAVPPVIICMSGTLITRGRAGAVVGKVPETGRGETRCAFTVIQPISGSRWTTRSREPFDHVRIFDSICVINSPDNVIVCCSVHKTDNI